LVKLRIKGIVFITLVIIIASVIIPTPVSADGGPMVDPLLFAQLQEGQQVAVIRLQGNNTASVDLFVSILDKTGESHDVTYFVPLGIGPGNFQAAQEDSVSFANSQTADLDQLIFRNYQQNQQFLQGLFAGALLTNGVWLTPLWLPMLLSSCSSPAAPVATFTTPSSQINIFNIDETTDLDALISTTGLNPSVKDALSRLKGQQIAVINLETTPSTSSIQPSVTTSPAGEPGLHLSWVTSLTTARKGQTYAYPLGTGASWASPIVMTGVYVVAPQDLNFEVQYPKLGINRSGFVVQNGGKYEPNIASYTNVSAYAVDDGMGPLTNNGILAPPTMRVWRVTYTNSNSTKDITITVNPNHGTAFGTYLRNKGPGIALIIGILVAILFWILAWYFLAPRLVGKNQRIRGLWKMSLPYLGLNLVLFVPGAILLFYFYFGVRIIPLIILVTLFGFASIRVFVPHQRDRLKEVSGKAFKIFFAITAASGIAYLLFAVGYAWLVRAI
jgi:hypothetical protein